MAKTRYRPLVIEVIFYRRTASHRCRDVIGALGGAVEHWSADRPFTYHVRVAEHTEDEMVKMFAASRHVSSAKRLPPATS